MADPFIGEIRLVGFNFAPVGWAMCNGSLLSIDQNQALFQLIGTTYGGDGVNTFNLPNLQSRVPIHQGTSPFSGNAFIQGQLSGSETVTLNTTQIPSHNHPLQASSAAATATSPLNAVLAASTGDIYIPPTTVVSMSERTNMAGGSQPHDNIMPYLTVTFIIALEGIYPSRS